MVYLLLLTACLVLTFMASAQLRAKPFSLHAGIQGAIPVSKDLVQSHSLGFGPYLDAQYMFNAKLGAAARVSFDHFLGKKYSYGDYTPGQEPIYQVEDKYEGANVVNLTGGVRYYATESLYLQAMIGISGKKWQDESRTRPLGGGGAGYVFPIGSQQKQRSANFGFNFLGMCEASFFELFVGFEL